MMIIRSITSILLFFSILLSPLLAIDLRIHISSHPILLPNPSLLPGHTTRAELSSHGPPLLEPLTAYNYFNFRSVGPGSYLLTAVSQPVTFENLRIDVWKNDTTGEEEARAWTTWRGNEWSNKGEVRGEGSGSKPVDVQLRVKGPREYFVKRNSFSVLSIFRSPMILIGGFTLVLVLGMPYLMDNLDPEVKAEFEAMQRKSRGSNQGAAAAAQIQNMDFAESIASWMAGKSTTSTGAGASKQESGSKKRS